MKTNQIASTKFTENHTLENSEVRKIGFKEISFFILAMGLFLSASAQSATASKISSFYSWLKPIVTAILLILTLVFAGRLLFKMAFRQQEAGMDLAWFIVFLAFWGLWAIFASDILAFFGVAASF